MPKSRKRLICSAAGLSALLFAHTAFGWSWSDHQRGWVDSVRWTTYVGPVAGPIPPPGRVNIRGWACLSPEMYWLAAYGYGSSLAVEVYQGGPPGVGVQRPVTLSFTLDLQPVVDYGACANLNNGFHLHVDEDPALPHTFYVRYLGGQEPIVLEGEVNAVDVP